MSSFRLAWLSFIRRGWGLLLIFAPVAVLFALVTLFFAVQIGVRSLVAADDWDRSIIRLQPKGFNFTRADINHIKQIPHVKMVGEQALLEWYSEETGGAKPATCTGTAVDYLKIWRTRVNLTDAQYDEWAKQKDGVIITETSARRHGWKVGQTISVPIPEKETYAQFRVSFISSQGLGAFDEIYVHPDYAESLLGEPMIFWVAWVLVDDPKIGHQMGVTLQEAFPGKKFTLGTMASVKSMLAGASALLVTIFSACGVLALVLVLGIALTILTLSIEERRSEIATLRAIGFRKLFILRAVMIESILMLTPGAVVGGVATYLVFMGRTIRMVSVSVAVTPTSVGLVIAAGALLGMFASLVPGIKAAGIDVLGALRGE